ncbi:GDSL esterase/lipase At2g04570-like [Aristolochia californica]|uniref:GDSL esterase/lipase At2g04570-like n=1 Tax=Aristolochia californica TaxID=171875 RepID=UPI0035E056FD
MAAALLFSIHLSLLLAVCNAASGNITAVIVFGDSSVDPGNNNQISTIAKSNFGPYGRDFPGGRPTGRFCNGRVATDFISDALGIKPEVPAYLDPAYSIKDFATGVSFASAATGYDNVTASVLNVIPIWKQLDYFREFIDKLRSYQGEAASMNTVSEALYVVSSGTNDFIENYYTMPTRQSQYKVDEYEDFVVGIAEGLIKQIYNLGGRRMSITGLPPMGCFPLERTMNLFFGSSCRDEYNQVALEFNGKMNATVEKLRFELPGSKLLYMDVYGIWMNAIDNPSSYGFENVEVACCATGMFEMGYMCNRLNPFTCQDANKYMFWDSFHPTQKTYHILADYFMNNSASLL